MDKDSHKEIRGASFIKSVIEWFVLIGCFVLLTTLYYTPTYRTSTTVQIDALQSLFSSIPRAANLSSSLAAFNVNLNVTKVLVCAYYRGGSSFFGDMFNHNPDVFYWFEPLAGVTSTWGDEVWPSDVSKTREWFYYKNATAKVFSENNMESITSTIQNIMSCELQKVSMSVYLHPFMLTADVWDKSIKMTIYKNCLKQSSTGQVNVTEADVKKCLPYLIDQCRKSSMIVIKSIRLRMDIIPHVTKRVADLRVIYLTRDPRGVLNSWWKLFHSSRRAEAEIDSKLLCKQMEFDSEKYDDILKYSRGTLCKIKYEDFAKEPLKIATLLHSNFLSRSIPEKVYSWLWRCTHSKTNNGMMGTKRRNSTAVAYSWRNSIKPAYRVYIQHHCKHSIIESGYEFYCGFN